MDIFVGFKSLWCTNLATDEPIHYLLIFISASWDFCLPLTIFDLKSLLQVVLTADVVVEAVLL